MTEIKSYDERSDKFFKGGIYEMKVYLLSPPVAGGEKRVREGRCMAKEGVWTTLWPPISMAEIAAVLEQKGFKVKITDAGVDGVDEKKLVSLLREFNPDVLMLNTTTPTIESDLAIAALAKKNLARIKTVAFGIHVGELPQQCMNTQKDLDFIVHNEPELTSSELITALRDGGGVSGISGITYRDGDRIITNSPRPYIEDLNSLPFPAWHLIDTGKYRMPYTRKRYLMVTPARGCPYHCIFCVAKGYYGHRLRIRSPESVVKELEWGGREFGIKDFLFWTESFTLSRKFVMRVCELIVEKGLDIRWVCNSRVDNVDFEMLQQMKKAGCWMIGYGVESSNQEILDRSKKGIKVEQIKEACDQTKKAGIEISAHIVLGLPGETRQTIKDTVRFAKRMGFDYAQFYCATPWPGTELYKIAQDKNWLRKDAPWSDYEQDVSVLDMEGLTAKELTHLRERAFKSFYLYPLTVWRTLRKIKSFSELKYFLWMVKKFLTWTK